MKKILLVITGSVAIYKTLYLIRFLKKKGYIFNIVITKSASELVSKLLIQKISGSEIYDDLFTLKEKKISHISLSRESDLILIAPATANFISKIALGIADDFASTVLLASKNNVIIAPAMNGEMWNNFAIQRNLTMLKEQNMKIIDPKVDILACEEYGMGKMAEPEFIAQEVDNFFFKTSAFVGKKILITTGATYEPIDRVRFIGNYSSGKQGLEIANYFIEHGSNVTMIASNIRYVDSTYNKVINVTTTNDMHEAVISNIKNADIFISAAAVSDFKVKNICEGKIKKSNNKKTLSLVENIDILKNVSFSSNRPKIVVGFAAEDTNLIENAKIKLKNKNCDLIIANNIKKGEVFGSDYNEISVVNREGRIKNYKKSTKKQVAKFIGEEIEYLIQKTCS